MALSMTEIAIGGAIGACAAGIGYVGLWVCKTVFRKKFSPKTDRIVMAVCVAASFSLNSTVVAPLVRHPRNAGGF